MAIVLTIRTSPVTLLSLHMLASASFGPAMLSLPPFFSFLFVFFVSHAPFRKVSILIGSLHDSNDLDISLLPI